MRPSIAPAFILILFMGCGKSDQQTMIPQGQSNPIPAAAAAMDSKLTTGIASLMPRVPRFEGSLVAIFNPGTPLAQGVAFTPDVSPGAPPHSFTFSGPYDGNGDGLNETTISGRATFNSDPNIDWTGVTGSATVDVAIPILGHVYHADITFSITSAERQLSGSGTFTDPLTGNATTMTVPAAAPLLIKPATGTPGAVSNACGYSMEGRMNLEVTGPSGTLSSIWNFLFNSASVAVNNRTFTDSSGQITMLPDTTVDTTCGGSGTIDDWTGSYDQNWVCLPRESGRATITMSLSGPASVSITDEDPPGSGNTLTYAATTIGANPHTLRGLFITGPLGFRYREDFNWTMRKSLSGFAQSSTYVYIEGPNTGKGGLCVASAPRL